MIHTQTHIFKNSHNLKSFISTHINLKQQKNLLIQLFSISNDENYISEIQTVLLELLPDAHLIGTTTDGSISEFDAEQTLISFTFFEKSTLRHTLCSFDIAKEDICAKEIATHILTEKSKVLILFADGLLCNAEKLTREIHKYYPKIIIAGGLAGDNAKLQKTLVCDNKQIKTQAVVALSIESDSLYIHNDYNLAWEPVEFEMHITKATQNIIYEIDGEKASLIFEKYLNSKHLSSYTADPSRPTISIEFPLIIKHQDMQVARVIMQINEDGSLVGNGEFKENDIISFSFTDSDKILKSGIALSKRMMKIPVQTMFIYSCMARRRFMGENISLDLNPLYKIAPLSGFYSYGEIYTASQEIEFLNHTMTVLALSEENEIYSKSFATPIQTKSHRAETISVLTTLLSKTNSNTPNLHQINNTLSFNSKTLELFIEGITLKTTFAESKLFEILFLHKGASVEMTTIFSHVWEKESKEFTPESVRTLVKKLRKKISSDTIESIYGGYYKLIVAHSN